jgi:hypothetical protein
LSNPNAVLMKNEPTQMVGRGTARKTVRERSADRYTSSDAVSRS